MLFVMSVPNVVVVMAMCVMGIREGYVLLKEMIGYGYLWRLVNMVVVEVIIYRYRHQWIRGLLLMRIVEIKWVLVNQEWRRFLFTGMMMLGIFVPGGKPYACESM